MTAMDKETAIERFYKENHIDPQRVADELDASYDPRLAMLPQKVDQCLEYVNVADRPVFLKLLSRYCYLSRVQCQLRYGQVLSTLQEQLKKLKLKAPAVAGAGTGAGLASWPADAPGCVNREPGLETSFFDPVDMLTAGIGVSGMRKALSMVMEPAVAYGMAKTGNWVGNRVKGLLEYFMGMMNDARGEVEREVQEKAEKKACAP